jgi:hypothetical protein
MATVPVYTAVARFEWGAGPDVTSAGVAVLGSPLDEAGEGAAPLSIDVPLTPGISRWETSETIAGALRENGWRVAGHWDRSSDVAWAVTAERIVTCLYCRAEIWWRIPARLADRPETLGAWCDALLDDTCACTPVGDREHEPRHAESE